MLLHYLNKQIKYKFSGVININHKTGKFIGRLFLENGKVINAKTTYYKGPDALLFLLFITHENKKNFKVFCEAGNHWPIHDEINLDFLAIINKLKVYSEEILQIRKLNIKSNKPYKLSANPSIKNGNLSKFEAFVLGEIIENSSPSRLIDENHINEIDLGFSLLDLLSKGIITESIL